MKQIPIIFKWFLLSLICLLLGFVGGLVYGQFMRVKITPVASVSPLPSINPAADKKNYLSQNLGFSFQYPQSWFLNEAMPENVSVTSTDLNLGGNLEAGFNVKRHPNPQKLGFVDWCSQNECVLRYNLGTAAIYPTTVAGLPAFRQDPDAAPEDIVTFYVFVSKAEFIYEISGSFNLNQADRNVLFNNFLATFKFTATNQAACQASRDCPAGYFCNSFTQTCHQELPD